MGVDSVTLRPAVFLDRDGVINRPIIRSGRPHPPASVDDLEVLPGVPEALKRLKAAGFALVVVTNQPDVARGAQTRESVAAIHERLMSLLPLDEIRVCWHDDEDHCDCRKPKPGLITRPPAYDLARSAVVGDRWRDIDAGHNAGCAASILVEYDYDEGIRTAPDARVGSLTEAADWILSTMVTR